MKRIITTAIALLAGLSLASIAPAVAQAQSGRLCLSSITFEPQSDYTAYNIRGQNIGCPRAIAVAVRVSVDGTLRPYGFHCRGKGVNQGLAHSDFRCVRGSSVVTFSAS
jgi:hypothetical protein